MNHARARANAYVRQLERKRTVRRDRTVGEPLSAMQLSRADRSVVTGEPIACLGCGYMVCDCESRVPPKPSGVRAGWEPVIGGFLHLASCLTIDRFNLCWYARLGGSKEIHASCDAAMDAVERHWAKRQGQARQPAPCLRCSGEVQGEHCPGCERAGLAPGWEAVGGQRVRRQDFGKYAPGALLHSGGAYVWPRLHGGYCYAHQSGNYDGDADTRDEAMARALGWSSDINGAWSPSGVARPRAWRTLERPRWVAIHEDGSTFDGFPSLAHAIAWCTR